MKKENIIRSKRLPDGSYVQILSDGSTQPMPPGKTDWDRLDAMTDEEAEANALADLDNPPMTKEQLKKMKPVSFVKRLRWKLGLSQSAFATQFHIPLGTLRDWEQHRTEPDKAVQAYLEIIAAEPDTVADILKKAG